MDSENTPKFFKIILKDTIKEGRLEIPTGFVTEFGNCISNPTIILEVPNGKKWQVELSKVGENQVWLEKGWVEFTDHYSLKYGHLLVFEYAGNSHFNVHIFDMSAMEIDYPDMNNNVEETTSLISTDQHIHDFGGNVARSPATNFTPTNPRFEIVVNWIHCLAIPFSFVEEHTECETKTVMLKVEDKSWPVKLYVHLNKRLATITGRLACFVRDNSLKKGDVCVFELISSDTFNVTISRI